MIAIVDYGVGNLFSLSSSFKKIGAEVVVTGDKKIIESADKIILPGVGAFKDAMQKLTQTGLDKVVIEQAKLGKHILGICLGMQLLFEKSFEFGECKGLGLLKGEIVGMQGVLDKSLKIPHIGWNSLQFKKDSYLNKYIKQGDYVYFVHSFYASGCEESLVSVANYQIDIPATVQNQNVCGCQFHPEKSGDVGLNILKAFCE